MKSSTQGLLVITALVVCAVTAATARAADSSAPEVADPGEHILHLKAPPEIMKIYDVDQNGTLDEDERAILHEDIASGKIEPPRRLFHHRRHLPPEILAQYDANKDGKLDAIEHAALRADVAAGKLVLPHRLGRGMPAEIREQYDTNKDGELDETERAALHADIESGKLPPPPHGRGVDEAQRSVAPAN
jgi:hypothetical protein